MSHTNPGRSPCKRNKSHTQQLALHRSTRISDHCRILLGNCVIYSIALLSRDGQIRMSVIQTIWSPQDLPRESPFHAL
jgi:hypothetical protein